MQLLELKKKLIFQFSSEAQIIKSIHKVSDNFTINRDELGDYLQRPQLVAAYTYFYFPTNVAKFEQVIEKLGLNLRDYTDYQVIDYGCGPGTYLYAAINAGFGSEYIGIESAELMRQQANEILAEYGGDHQIKILPQLGELPDTDKKRLLIFGHSANEMDMNSVLNIIKKTAADEILFIEPGTKDFFEKMKSLRESLINDHYNPLYPCPSANSCPMAIEGSQDWCHQILKVNLSDDVKRLCQLVKKDRIHQPVSLFYFKRHSEPALNSLFDQNEYRVVRVFKETKFSLEFLVCHAGESDNTNSHIQFMKKKLSKDQGKKLRQVYAGDMIQFSVIETLKNGILRGELE